VEHLPIAGLSKEIPSIGGPPAVSMVGASGDRSTADGTEARSREKGHGRRTGSSMLLSRPRAARTRLPCCRHPFCAVALEGFFWWSARRAVSLLQAIQSDPIPIPPASALVFSSASTAADQASSCAPFLPRRPHPRFGISPPAPTTAPPQSARSSPLFAPAPRRRNKHVASVSPGLHAASG
jgi:hypothetical protein